MQDQPPREQENGDPRDWVQDAIRITLRDADGVPCLADVLYAWSKTAARGHRPRRPPITRDVFDAALEILVRRGEVDRIRLPVAGLAYRLDPVAARRRGGT